MPRIHKIVAVLMILGAFTVAAAVVRMQHDVRTVKEARARADLRAVATQVRTFHETSGRLPTDAEGLHVLVERPPNVQSWSVLFRELPIDPWDRPYQYRRSAESPDGFDVFTLGPSTRKASDDIHFEPGG